jgi:hypothetical protein
MTTNQRRRLPMFVAIKLAAVLAVAAMCNTRGELHREVLPRQRNNLLKLPAF